MKGSGRGCGDTVQGRARGEIIKKFFFSTHDIGQPSFSWEGCPNHFELN